MTRSIRPLAGLVLACFVCLALLVSASSAKAATKIPVELEIDASGATAEDFGHQIEKYFRASDFYALDKKRAPRIALSVNAAGKKDSPIVTYALVLSVVTAKCPPAFVGVIFGDTTDEEPKALQDKIEKAIMAIAKQFNL